MLCPERRFHRRVVLFCRFDQQQYLIALLQTALPFIDRSNLGDEIDTGGEFPLNQMPGEGRRCLPVRRS